MSMPVLVLPNTLAEVPLRTTPSILWRALWVLWGLDVIVLAAFLYSGHVHRIAIQSVGKNAAPSVITAQKIRAALADMDADVANELLAEAGSEAAATEAFNSRRQLAAGALISAAENISYGAAERQPILAIELNLGKYEALVQQARDLRDEGKPGFLAAYQKAAALMDNTILPAADSLDKVNLDELETAYASERSNSTIARFLVGGAVMAMLAVLTIVQVYLFRRTNRVFNVPLLAATVLLSVFVVYTLNNLHTAGRDLKRAKEDAFTSMHALWQAWALAYSAKGDESRWLLDSMSQSASLRDFDRKRDSIATLPAGQTWFSTGNSSDPRAASGYLADELDNVHFGGERLAAQNILRAFSGYVLTENQVRSLQRLGRNKEAIALGTGTAPGQLNWTFNQFSAFTEKGLNIDQRAFDSAVDAGVSRLSFFDLKASVVAAIISILCMLGLMQRIREYN